LLAGITLKLADFYGERDPSLRQYGFALMSALAFGYLIAYDSMSSSIFLGIIGGVLFAGKINRVNLVFGLILAFITAGIAGFQAPILWLMISVLFSSWCDEWCHDRFTVHHRATFVFRFRPVLKLVMLLFAMLALVEMSYIVGFFAFDGSYDFTNWALKRHHAAAV